jgi:hypothetical protein
VADASLGRAAVTTCLLASSASTQPVLNGPDAYGDWLADAPGVRCHITPDTMPPPFTANNASLGLEVVVRPRRVVRDVPAGFEASLFATDLVMRLCPAAASGIETASPDAPSVCRGSQKAEIETAK